MATTEFLQQLMGDPDRLAHLVNEAKEEAFLNGLIFRTEEDPDSSEVVTYSPFPLFPSPLPKSIYHQALALQIHFNTLMDRISQEPGFLEDALSSTIQADDFTAKLFDIYKRVQQEGQTQSIVVGLNRSDYMLDQGEDGTPSLKQIEINTVAVGCFGLYDRLPVVHRRTLKSAGLLKASERVQDSNNTSGMCAALAGAWELYGQQGAVVMFLVEDDVQIWKLAQRYIENELWNRNIPVIRRKFEDVSRRGSLNDDKKLIVDGLEVAVVYYRYGYMPEHYKDQAWDARLLMERSLAVKCPDIGTHLAGTKKVQQVLARPGVLERFFPGQPRVVEDIRATFAGQYTLDMGPEGDKTIEMALAAPDQFVLKPQREGGGNNIYGSEIFQVLQRVKGSPERMAYILMDKLQPRPIQNILLKRKAPVQISNCVSELGVFGAYVRKNRDMVMNECVGHVLKTRSVDKKEAGLLTEGVSVLDMAILV